MADESTTDFTLAMATPEAIVDALASYLSPEALARVTELIVERLPSAITAR